ncbi:hypothetical protein GYMLUDRAFT_245943 [Collybiopsis luxurians FD-317 M1]|uniref:Hydrophobin n=1 Tax=Collybiopsis luxurians FD-317 M1 TaxID=944289 RepID=A0A0D0C7U7_9AGAR|nr:hypothetical protein GYMLUDRAFT_245943 [Collybiopsis luxurians FD-317 M1]
MQFKLTFVTAAIASLAAATPTPRTGSCSTGPVQCCNSVEYSSDAGVAGFLGLLGIVLQNTNVPIGFQCSPISAVGIGSTCSSQAVCFGLHSDEAD